MQKNKINRSAKSGKFVTEKFAKKHKATTTSEKIKPREKFKVYELDFGIQNLLSQDYKEILEWIGNDMCDLKVGDNLNYFISIRMMTAKQIADIPEWGS